MRSVARSVMAREQVRRLQDSSVDQERNIDKRKNDTRETVAA